MVGGHVGGMFGGPIGAQIGSMIGGQIGQMLSGMINDFGMENVAGGLANCILKDAASVSVKESPYCGLFSLIFQGNNASKSSTVSAEVMCLNT